MKGQVLARIANEGEAERGFSREIDLHPVGPDLPALAERLARALERIIEPLRRLAERLAARLADEADELDSALRGRIEAAGRSLKRRALDPLTAWRTLLAALIAVLPAGRAPALGRP